MNIEQIAARHAAAMPGPYSWGGNTDLHDVHLQTRIPGEGIVEILGTRNRERTKTDREVDQALEYLLECRQPQEVMAEIVECASWDDEQALEGRGVDDIYDEDTGEYDSEFLDIARRAMARRWVYDKNGEVRSDSRLYLTTKSEGERFHHLDFAEDQVVYTVARSQGLPEDTARDHRAVYRADVCDVRNPTARFLASAWSDVATLLDQVQELREENTRLRAQLQSGIEAMTS